ncbi:MAG: hypothetical protein AAFY48_00780 [Bacteroidota bacterium]
MKLQIGTGNNRLDLRRGTSVQIDMSSPLYFADNRGSLLPSVKNYPIRVPNTARNQLLLGRPADLDNPADFLEQEGWWIEFDGYRILEGKIEVKDGVYEGDIEFDFIGGLAGNLEALKTKNLRDLAIPSIALGDNDGAVLATIATMAADTDADYVFPIIRVDPTGQREDDPDDESEEEVPTRYTFVNYYRNGEYLTNDEDQLFPPGSGGQFGGETRPFRATIAPQPLLRPVLERLMEAVQYDLVGVFDSHPLKGELNELVLFSNYTLDVQNSSPQDELTFANVSLSSTYTPSRSMPDKSGADLIKAVVNLFCLAPILDTTGRRLILVSCQDLLDIPPVANWTAKVTPKYRKGRRLDEVPNKFMYEDPNESYSSGYPRVIRLSQVDDSFETVGDAEAAYTIADVGKTIYIADLNEYFETRLADFGTGQGLYLAPLGKDLGVIGEGNDTPYTPTSTTLHSLTTSFFDGTNIGWRLSFGLEPEYGTGPRLGTAYFADLQTPLQDGDPLEDIIFLIHRGLIIDRDGNLMPYAGSSAYNYFGQPMGEMSLLWTGERGLYNVWWKKWIEALEQMRPVPYPTRLTAADLANLDWRNKVVIDRHIYFLKRIQVTLTTDEILTAAVEYMQVN